jgi:diguanylate cyclase
VETGLPPERLLGIITTQNEIIATGLDLDAVLELVVTRARSLTAAASAVIELVEGDELAYRVASGSAAARLDARLPVDPSLSGLTVRHGEVVHCVDVRADDRIDRAACESADAVSLVSVPLRYDERIAGVLKIYDPEPSAFNEHDVETLRLLSGVVGAHMVQASESAVRQHESRHDAVTGLPNRRAFAERLSAEIARVRRYGGDLALAVLDLENFSQLGESLAQSDADRLLRGVASHLLKVREEDTAFRIGADEFALIMVGASAEDGRIVLDRIMRSIDEDPGCQSIGISGGIAEVSQDDDEGTLLDRATASMRPVKSARDGDAHPA